MRWNAVTRSTESAGSCCRCATASPWTMLRPSARPASTKPGWASTPEAGTPASRSSVSHSPARSPRPPPPARLAGCDGRADQPAYVGQVPGQLGGDLGRRPPEPVGEIGVQRGEARPAADRLLRAARAAPCRAPASRRAVSASAPARSRSCASSAAMRWADVNPRGSVAALLIRPSAFRRRRRPCRPSPPRPGRAWGWSAGPGPGCRRPPCSTRRRAAPASRRRPPRVLRCGRARRRWHGWTPRRLPR